MTGAPVAASVTACSRAHRKAYSGRRRRHAAAAAVTRAAGDGRWGALTSSPTVHVLVARKFS